MSMNNMETTEIVKQAEGLANDEEKLMFLGKYLGDNLDVLEPRDFIQLLTFSRYYKAEV